MTTTQIATNLAHQDPQGPLAVLEPEENQGLGGAQDSLARPGCRDPLVNEVRLSSFMQRGEKGLHAWVLAG